MAILAVCVVEWRAAIADAVVEAQARLPMAQYWGLGLTASSDGQFFATARQGEAMNLVNAKYGNEPGLKAYTHLSDQFAPFATQTIPATVHEAPYILDRLLMNDAGRRVREQYADTGDFTDHVFVATALLGYQFIPRIRDLPSKRLHVFDSSSTVEKLNLLGLNELSGTGKALALHPSVPRDSQNGGAQGFGSATSFSSSNRRTVLGNLTPAHCAILPATPTALLRTAKLLPL